MQTVEVRRECSSVHAPCIRCRLAFICVELAIEPGHDPEGALSKSERMHREYGILQSKSGISLQRTRNEGIYAIRDVREAA